MSVASDKAPGCLGEGVAELYDINIKAASPQEDRP